MVLFNCIDENNRLQKTREFSATGHRKLWYGIHNLLNSGICLDSKRFTYYLTCKDVSLYHISIKVPR